MHYSVKDHHVTDVMSALSLWQAIKLGLTIIPVTITVSSAFCTGCGLQAKDAQYIIKWKDCFVNFRVATMSAFTWLGFPNLSHSVSKLIHSPKKAVKLPIVVDCDEVNGK